ncbi:MAG TPA: SDR family NAD(P)-dependent oxidoreductase [Solirubrobacteraceae bacterium]|nr:SDR family NAD(P)-dependent oxidoreductase [Solirubrobacteraceae bacterium]
MQIGSGTRAVVTGASRGIGRAVAHALAERGATVGLAARSTSALELIAAALPGAHHPLTCDVALPASITAAVETFVAAEGGVDLLVANAGIAHYEPIAEQSLEHIEWMTQVNWLGTVHTVQAALPHMLGQSRGHIVVMSSGAGLRGFPGAAAYGATKAAQRVFAEALRHELAGSGVSVTTVFPGEIRTSLHDHERARMPAWYRGGPSAASAEVLAQRIVKAVERDRRTLHYRPLVKGMGILHGVSPVLADRVLRRLRGATAAPRRD